MRTPRRTPEGEGPEAPGPCDRPLKPRRSAFRAPPLLWLGVFLLGDACVGETGAHDAGAGGGLASVGGGSAGGGSAAGGGAASGGGTASGGGAQEADLVVTVDFSATAYPPIPRKLGFNTTWNETGAADSKAVQLAASAGLPMVGSLIETFRDGGELGPTATLPLFCVDGGVVTALANANLLEARQPLAASGVLNFMQLAGTPPQFPIDPTQRPSAQGNWYPTTPLDAGLDPAVARAFADLTDVLSAAGPATLWAFWQEPDHTLSATYTPPEALARYVHLYAALSRAIRARDPDSMIVGGQQNAAAGLSPNHALDGAQYLELANQVLAVEADAGALLPLDAITIQNYQAESSAELLQNSRLAYRSPRFNVAPTILNEFDFDKNDAFDVKYDTADGGMRLLDTLEPNLRAADVDAVLVKSRLYAQPVLTQPVLLFLAGMSELSRPVTVTGAAGADLHVLATGDAHSSSSVLLWNPSPRAHTVRLELSSPASFTVRALDGGVVATGPSPLVVDVPSNGALMARAGTLPGAPLASYARHVVWCDRSAGVEMPHGSGHYDVRSGTLTVGTAAASDGRGLAGVVLRHAPARLMATVDSSGLAPGALSLRVDYLEGAATTATVYLVEPQGSAWPALPGWRAAGATAQTVGTSFATPVTVDLELHAPPGWSSGARRAQVSALLQGTPAGPAAARVSLVEVP
jgi:hypothetical protein